jgi:divalent metal cation (Fe/Co/Zn/Cd) transporter
VGNALIAATKLGAAVFTGSAAMLSEGIHSVVDTGNQAFLLLGRRRAQQLADAAHPLGHERLRSPHPIR